MARAVSRGTSDKRTDKVIEADAKNGNERMKLAAAEVAKRRAGSALNRVWGMIDAGAIQFGAAEEAEAAALRVVHEAGAALKAAEAEFHAAVVAQSGNAWALEVLADARDSAE